MDKQIKAKTAEELFDSVIKFYNQSVNDVYKFQFNKHEKDIFLNMMEDYAQSQLSELKKENDTLKNGLEEISEVTVMQGDYKEAFEIVQNIVNHLINKTER